MTNWTKMVCATHVDLLPTKVRLGFTLAEVLITLGIIGIVAAMTIPTLMQKYYEKQTVAHLKETYSILTQAIKTCGEEDGYPDEWGLTGRNPKSTEIAAEKLLPYLKVSVDCGTFIAEKNENFSCFSDEISYLNNTKGLSGKSPSRHYITLLNGTSVAFESGDISNDVYLYFLVDTNGKSKPNAWGKDVFEFVYKPSLGLIPSGHPTLDNSYKLTCHSPKDMGYGCAYYILNFGDMDYLHHTLSL